MPRCFWFGKCDCPDKTPNGNACDTHSKYGCSILNGRAITNLNQIQDANTTLLETAKTAVANDANVVRAIRARLTNVQNEVRQLQSAAEVLERELPNASFMQRRRLLRRARGIRDKLRGWTVRLERESGNIDTVVNRNLSAVGTGLTLLSRPYLGDPHGCKCATTKIAVLQSLDRRLTAYQQQLARQQALYSTYGTRLWAMAAVIWVALTALSNVGLALAVFSLPAFIVAVVGFAVLLGTYITMFVVWLRIAESIRVTKWWILRYTLFYYRIQQIPACRDQKVASTEGLYGWNESFLADLPFDVVDDEDGIEEDLAEESSS